MVSYYYNNFNKQLFLKIKLKKKKILEIKKVTKPILSKYKINEFKPLVNYFSGKKEEFKLGLDLSNFSDSVEKVLVEIRKIPYGKCLTYSRIAEELCIHPRYVGYVCRINPFPIIVPCHRVISKNGSSHYQWGGQLKKFLQDLEKNT